MVHCNTVIWYDVVWYGMLQYDMVQYSILWGGMQKDEFCFLVNYFVRKSKSLSTARRERPVLVKKMPVLCSGIEHLYFSLK